MPYPGGGRSTFLSFVGLLQTGAVQLTLYRLAEDMRLPSD